MKQQLGRMTYNTDRKAVVEKCLSYFQSGIGRMKYSINTKANLPIGSGVTEAACKIIVKQRLCQSGARWSKEKAGKIMLMRCLNHSGNRWNEFWEKRQSKLHH